MTSIANCLLDAGKKIRGSDLAEDFVTKKNIARMQAENNLVVDPLDNPLPEDIDCVIYTAAHHGIDQAQVQAALTKGLPVLSQAEALAQLFNQKLGLAVCGVGGKSTASAMMTWILNKIQPQELSYSVGVGEIIGLTKTGQWQEAGRYFVAEADEYVIDPNAKIKGEALVPRFSFLQPHLTVCNNLKFDHPDVYADFDHTKETFIKFFLEIKSNGYLLINADDEELSKLTRTVREKRSDLQIQSFGESAASNFKLSNFVLNAKQNTCQLEFGGESCQISLTVPGQFNLHNAAAAIAACRMIGISLTDSAKALESFQSTSRRFQLVKDVAGKKYFDDYAHHPSEIKAVIKALQDNYPKQKRLIAFQPHTYSRTKQLLNEFVEAFGESLTADDQLVLLDIFPSAREAVDPSVSSDLLLAEMQKTYPQINTRNIHSINGLAAYLQEADYQVAITLGAGDIYQVYDLF